MEFLRPASGEEALAAEAESASRQTYMTGGAVERAREAVRDEVLAPGRRRFGARHPGWARPERLADGEVVTEGGGGPRPARGRPAGRGGRPGAGVPAPAAPRRPTA